MDKIFQIHIDNFIDLDKQIEKAEFDRRKYKSYVGDQIKGQKFKVIEHCCSLKSCDLRIGHVISPTQVGYENGDLILYFDVSFSVLLHGISCTKVIPYEEEGE